MKKILSFALAILFLLPSLYIGVYFYMNMDEEKIRENPSLYLKKTVAEAVSSIPRIGDIAPKLLYTMYPSQRDGIFITGDYLLEDIKDMGFSEKNAKTIEEFSERTENPCYFVLVPTAIAIKQQELPVRANIYNQRKLIDDSYKACKSCKNVDCYSELFSVRDQYVYYRTEPLNTSLGGYYIYHSLLKSMKETPKNLDEFSVAHKKEDIKGSFAERIDLKGTREDTISIYECTQSPISSVEHYKNGETRKYYSLYPDETGDEGFATIKGGFSTLIRIVSNEGKDDKVLVIGDENAVSILPFLASDFNSVTFVNSKEAKAAELNMGQLQNYDKIVFCFNSQSITEDLGLETLLKLTFPVK